MFGDVGSISDNIFYMGTQNGSRLEKCWSRIFDSHLRIKVMALFPIQWSHAFAMFLAHALRECALFRNTTYNIILTRVYV